MPSQTFLITGCTGFLGSAIAIELIKQGKSKQILMLVRADSMEQAVKRIHDQLKLFEIDNIEQLITADNIILGDLSSETWFKEDKAQRITHIINCAAIASFGNNPNIMTVNVDHTFSFAQGAATLPHLVRFTQVGTGMACGVQAPSPVCESYDIFPDSVHLVPYTFSKATVEHKIKTEIPTLPFVVVRPSIVVGHTTLGVKPSASIFWVLRMGEKLREFLCEYDSKVDIIPVDWCAQAILKLTEKESLKYNKYHISAGVTQSCSFREIDAAWAKAEGKEQAEPYKQVGFDHLYARKDEFEALFGKMEEKIMLKAIKLYGGFSLLNFLFKSDRLQEEGIAPSPRLTDYVDVCIASSGDATIAEQMSYDFK